MNDTVLVAISYSDMALKTGRHYTKISLQEQLVKLVKSLSFIPGGSVATVSTTIKADITTDNIIDINVTYIIIMVLKQAR